MHFFHLKKELFQSGRSLVEILAVLAIIGVLTLGSIVGLSYLFARQNANDTVGEANSRLWAIKTSPALDFEEDADIDIDGYGATSRRGYDVRQYYEAGNLYAEVSNVPYRICQLSKATVGDREDLILEINVDPDGNSNDCQTDEARSNDENVLVFSLPADDEDTGTVGTGEGTENGPNVPNSPCPNIDTSGLDNMCYSLDEDDCILSYKESVCSVNGTLNGYCDSGRCISCGQNATATENGCECDENNHFVPDGNNGCECDKDNHFDDEDGDGVCECDNGYREVNGVCEEDLCFGKQISACQQCDPATGNVIDIICANGQVCLDGQCVCDAANNFVDNDEDGVCECDVGFTPQGNQCIQQGSTPCYGMTCPAGQWCAFDIGCRPCNDESSWLIDSQFEDCTVRCSNREIFNSEYCGIKCKRGERRDEDGYCLPLCSPNGTCNADSYCSEREGLCKPCSRSSVFLQDKENFYAQCPLSVCGREPIIGGKYLCYPCNSSLSSISRPEIERCEACPNRYYDEVSDKCKKR